LRAAPRRARVLTVSDLQLREARWVVVDLLGKRRRRNGSCALLGQDFHR
jgi:hypothetical protein